MLRFSRLSDIEILERLLQVCKEENVPYDDSGLEAIIFTAEGDMRNALKEATEHPSGFGLVNSENVFVCDQSHPEDRRKPS